VSTGATGGGGSADGAERGQTEPAPRSLFDGRYRVVRTLGAGGMGRVLLVEDLLQGERLVALKRFVPDGGHDVAAFLREFRIHRQLAHPNIPRAYELGFASAEGAWAGAPREGLASEPRTASQREGFAGEPRAALLPYFTMEVASGVPLTSIAERFEGRIPLRVIAAIATGLLRALDHLHRQGWLHGDLKPANVLVDQGAPRAAGSHTGELVGGDGRSERIGVHLIDFGVALARGKAIGDEVTATAEYAAPEVLEGGVVDARSDLYAVGLLLFEMIENRRPWLESDIDQLWARRRDEGPPPLTATSCPPALASLVRRLLASDPAERPTTASMVLEELSRATGWSEVIEPPEAFVQRLLTVPLPWRGWLEALAVRVTDEPLPPGEPWAIIVRIPAGFFARRLLGPVLDEAAARRARIIPLRFEAREPDESERAWAPVREVLGQLEPRGRPVRAWEEAGAERPMVLVVEGLAANDPEGLQALGQALDLGGPERRGVRLVATLNAGSELSEPLVAMLGAPSGVSIVDLPGWDGASMRAWLHRALGRIGAPWEVEAGSEAPTDPAFALPSTPAGVIEALAAFEREGHLVRNGEGYAWREVGVSPRDRGALMPGRRVEPLDALIACIKGAVPEAAMPPYLGGWVAELPELIGSGVLRARGDGTIEVGDEPRRATLYGQLGSAQRRAVHRRLAQALEEVLAPPHRIAEEWLDSDAPLLAVPHLLAAAEARPGRGWLERAMGLVARARELVARHGEGQAEDLELWRYEVLILRTEVRVLIACGELDRLDALVRRIAELGAETGHRHTIQVALELRMALDLRRRDWDRLVDDAAGLVALGVPATTSASFLRPRLTPAELTRVEPAAGRGGEHRAVEEVSTVARARLHWARALRFRAEGLPTAALTELEAGLGVFSGLASSAPGGATAGRPTPRLGAARDDIEARIVLLEARAELCLEVGWGELAAEAIDQLADVARRTGRATSRIKAQLLACERWREEGRVDRALALARESANGLPRERTPELDAAVELELGGCRFELGDLDLAMDHARFARALADDEGAATTSARGSILMARVAVELGRREEAWRFASEAAARVGASDPVSVWARLVVLEVALGLRGFAAADEVLRAASEMGFRAQRRLEGAKASAAFSLAAEAALTRRQHGMALDLAGRGVDAAREGAKRLLPRALWVLGRALLVNGKRPGAEACLAEARSVLLSMGDGFDDAELRERWLAHPERRAILGVDARVR
jgi:serine/threonine protein kinase/tetratricopeptide (TPR) repeat protein